MILRETRDKRQINLNIYYNMYICIVFNDLEQTRINGLIYFTKIKDIIKYSNNLLKYSDIKERQKCYKTYKSFFKFHKVRADHAIKYFCDDFYLNF